MGESYVQEKEREIEELLREPVLAFDFETTGLSPYRGAQIFGLAIAGADKEWYFNFNEIQDSPCISVEERRRILERIFHSDARIWLAHNAKFDLSFLTALGIRPVGEIWDTMVMARVEYNDHMSYSLEDCGERIGVKKDDAVKAYMNKHKLFSIIQIPDKKTKDKDYKFALVPTDIMEKYAKQDARVCYELFKQQRTTFAQWDIQKRPISPIVELEKKTTIVLADMEYEGIKIDKDYCKLAIEYYRGMMEAAKINYCAAASIPLSEFVDSNKGHSIVYTRLGLPFKKTKKGNPSFKEENLKPNENPLDRAILEYREAQKKISTFFSAFLYHVGNDGKIHTNLRQAGTATARLACAAPNLQQLSRDDDPNTAFPVRRAFIAEEGYSLLSIDYKAMEYRVMLDFAVCLPVIRKIIDEGMDLHQATAELMGHGITRQHAKTLGFCIAEDSKVLTDKGLVPIQCVTVDMKVWDGDNFVSHDGVIYQGEKEVIEYDGLIATPDHKVYTNASRKIRLDGVSSEQDDERILVTEIDGVPIRYSDAIKGYPRSEHESCEDTSLLSSLWGNLYFIRRQYNCKKDDKLQMPEESKIWGDARHCNTAINGKIQSSCTEMPQQELKKQKTLWRAWNRSKMFSGRVCEFLLNKLHKRANIEFVCGQDRQQWALRVGKFEVGYKQRKYIKHRKIEGKKKTYDILNAGPNHRFTVSGKLVSNCLLYGGGPGKLGEMLGIPLAEAKMLKEKYFFSLPEVQELIYGNKYTGKKGVIEIANERGYIINKFGRRYHFKYRWVMVEDEDWEGDPDDPARFTRVWTNFAYKAPNYLIQGTCSDVLRTAMCNIREFLLPYKTRMLVPIHDELVFKLANDEHHLIPELKRLMRDAFPHDHLPLDGSAEIGSNLYDMEKVS